MNVRKRVTHGDWPCVGCGRRKAGARRTYCPRCLDRLARGYQALDMDDFPTEQESRNCKVPGFEQNVTLPQFMRAIR